MIGGSTDRLTSAESGSSISMSSEMVSEESRSRTVPEPRGLRKIGRLPEPTAPRTLIWMDRLPSFRPSLAMKSNTWLPI